MNLISRKEFIMQAGTGAASLLFASCLSGCKKTSTSKTVDFTIDVSTGALSSNGGSLIQNGAIVARTKSGAFIAVSSTCTHQGGTLGYSSNSNTFICPVHGATFSSTGSVTSGPASTDLQKFNTSLSGNTLRVYS